jgi:branched-chain amino acid transport system permease protein
MSAAAAVARRVRPAALLWAAALLVALAVPFFANERQVFLGMNVAVFAVFATSFNVLLGYTGMVSFAHAAYYGIGSYAVTLAWVHWGVPPLAGFALAPLLAGAVAYLTGLIALRAVRLYFALLTLALGQLLYVVAFQWRGVTRGDDGIHGLPLPEWLLPTVPRYYLLVLLAVLALAILYVVLHSPFGATLQAIRENRERAGFLGIKVKRYELAAFTLGGTFAGYAGGMFALFERSSFPLLLHWTTSAEPIFITLIGGLNSFAGPLVGAVIFGLLRDWITRNFVYWSAVLGMVLLVIILGRPGGTVEALQRLMALVRPGTRPPSEAPVDAGPGEDADPDATARTKSGTGGAS